MNRNQGSTQPLARGQYIYGRASQTEQRLACWGTWASNFRFFQPGDFSYFRVIQYRLITRTNEISRQNVKIQLQSL
jgi:hypothetical protein